MKPHTHTPITWASRSRKHSAVSISKHFVTYKAKGLRIIMKSTVLCNLDSTSETETKYEKQRCVARSTNRIQLKSIIQIFVSTLSNFYEFEFKQFIIIEKFLFSLLLLLTSSSLFIAIKIYTRVPPMDPNRISFGDNLIKYLYLRKFCIFISRFVCVISIFNCF